MGIVLGAGSFATVHAARDDRLDDDVVVKVLAENHSINPEVRERFIAEGRALRRVRSPHVVAVHDIGESAGQQPFLVLERADRGTLRDRVRRLRSSGWTASVDDVLAVARGLTAAVEAVHRVQIVHRDLSPGNVLLTSAEATTAAPDETPHGTAPGRVVAQDERLLVADLGMCKDLAVSSGLTVAGGTEGFRPPEQSAGPGRVDTRADLWAMSALMRWLCDGAELPDALDDALHRSLAADPTDRHDDAAQWLADVERALTPPPVPRPPQDAQPVAAAPAQDAPDAPPRRRRTVRVAATASTAALVAGLTLGALLGPGPAPPDRTDTVRVAIEGPTQVSVGETATFVADVAGTEHWVWVLPTGQYVADEPSITLTPASTGQARVRLQTRDGDRPLEADLPLRVTP
nr:protein kinase [Isoptericola halotolerans]